MLACATIKWEHKTTAFEKFFMMDLGLWIMYLFTTLFPSTYKQMADEIGADLTYIKEHPEKLTFLKEFMNKISPGSLRWPGSKNDIIQYSKMDRYPVEKIKIPTLVVQSKSDKCVSMENAEFLADNMSNVEFYEYFTGGHAPMLGKESEEVYDKMIEFIIRHGTD